MTLAVTITPNSINLLLDGRMRTVDKSHANYNAVRDLIKDYRGTNSPRNSVLIQDKLRELIDIPSFIAKITEGKVAINDTAVMYDGKPTHGVIATRLLAMLADGFDVKPLARFLDKVMLNPQEDTRNDLYEWLERSTLPITEDGDFLAFKKVNPEFKSFHDLTIDNSIGSVVSMPREACDSNRHNTCSRGLHFCSFSYLSQYSGSEGHVVICKINPKDVCAIPYDYGITKGRACAYEIIGEVPEDECRHFFAGRSVVDSFGTYDSSEGEELEDDAEEGIDIPDIDPGSPDSMVVEDDAPHILEVKTAEATVEFTAAEIERAGDLDRQLTWHTLDEIHENLSKVLDGNLGAKEQAEYLNCGITWRFTDQGHDYWSQVFHTMEGGAPMPAEAKRIIEYWIAMLEKKTIVVVEPQPVIVGIDPAKIEPEAPKQFEHGGEVFKAKKIEKLVDKHGQRGAARITGVPRTTLQKWLRKLGLR